jgi:hypothetical protein
MTLRPVIREKTIFCLLWALTVVCSCSPALAAEILLDGYQDGLSLRWKEKSFEGNTRYEVTNENSQLCIKATSRSSASALYYKIKFDPKDYPTLTWRWKVNHVLSNGNALHKDGDDYAARVYVVFPSLAFWKTKALNYIWANKLPRGGAVANPFTENAMMIAVESGPERTGQWVEETRNVFQDYRRYFGEEPPRAGAIAIMTDTDNTGESAIAWYGPIRLMSDQSR